MSQRICCANGCKNPAKGWGRCARHYPVERFWEKVDKTDGCWIWTGARTRGYGQIRWDGGTVQAHRLSWEMSHGRPVPEGMQVDHLCHDPETCPSPGVGCPHRACVNPDHLEAVTPWENKRRSGTWSHLGEMHAAKTHCPQGHPYSAENTYLNPGNGHRYCIECRRERGRAWYHRNQDRRKA